MADKELTEYIKSEINKGVHPNSIRSALLDVGWSQEDVNNALQEANTEPSPSSSVNRPSGLEPLGSNGSDNHIVVNNSMEQDSSKPEKRKRMPKLFLLLSVLLLIALAVGAYLGYSYYYLAPERVLAKSIEQMEQVDRFQVSGSMNMKFTGDPFAATPEMQTDPDLAAMSLFVPKDFSFIFDGSIDAEDEENIKSNGKFTLTSNSVQLGELEYITLGEITYLKLNRVNTFGLLDLDDYIDLWFRLDPNELKEKYDVDYEEETTPTISEEQRDEIARSFQENPPIEIIEQLEDEELKGKNTFHYKYRVNKENLSVFYDNLANILKDYPGMEDFEVEEFKQSLQEIEFYEGEIWIGKDDYYIYEFTLGLFTETPDEEFKVDMTFDFAFDNFNQPVEIVEPADFRTIEDLEQMLLQEYQDIYGINEEQMQLEGLEDDELNSLLQVMRTHNPSVSGLQDKL